MTYIADTLESEKLPLTQCRDTRGPSDDAIAATKAAKAYQLCVLAGFALPAVAVLVFALVS